MANQSICSLHSALELVSAEHSTIPDLWSPETIPPEFFDMPTNYQRLIGPHPPSAFQCSEVAVALREDTELLGCSDGSYVDTTGQCYHGWILASEVRQTITEGSGPGHGHPDLLSSYRAELSGLLALVYMVYRISSYHGIHSGTFRIHCDNKSALAKAVTTAPVGITPFFTSDYDLIALIQLHFGLLPISAVGKWVKGHYSGDKKKYKHDLNDRVDQLATTAYGLLPREFQTKGAIPPPPGYRIRLLSQNGIITSKYYTMLSTAHHDQPLVEYIVKKTKWSPATFCTVDWAAHDRAFRRLSRFQHIGISKMIHNLSNTHRQNRLLYGHSDLCPGCRVNEETFEHVLQCSHAPTALVCTEALLVLDQSLTATATNKKVSEVMLGGFRDWLDPNFKSDRRSSPSTFGSVRPDDMLITAAYTHQFHTLGWYNFCLGRISSKWHEAVRACLTPRTPFHHLQWGSLLISALWKFIKTLWQHRNGLVHGSDAVAIAKRILTGL